MLVCGGRLWWSLPTIPVPPLTVDGGDRPRSDQLSVPWLRARVRAERPLQCGGRTLRFVRGGGGLASAQLAREWREFVTEGGTDCYYVHCVVGTEVVRDATELQLRDAAEEAALQDGSAQVGGEMGAIGFDRLRGLGFSDEEVELLRSQFRATYGDVIETETTGGGTRAEELRRLEEQWMENDAVADDDRFNAIPASNWRHNWDLLTGISVGFGLGVFSLILLRFDGLFNKRQHMSIVAGVLINFVFWVMRGF
ncbi:Dsc3p KNAG_0A03115 [Huiozyma naganishii CBS 8797]|uniref:DSC E3 ubiquitin ligase complex subunit 3 C-terminal domain-containing protein n=1 Tax=Huiozyma naganishii (strain ATCC MYA-139 / BCRC 22969 / CBS 8797 / KCTC 17520 / NBRC 10181 / NCYC 3082 / Yp74L-3) TaxID=1071383 RepID=J7QZT2_HUIN7|nr:hypothetical protein KNAG_0A03115 [Kazachstania naganishii CBS 8797]CCK68000.1 hypothetical protein KNAG_0A03115 [Kazachstania naganishii CBS 8797]